MTHDARLATLALIAGVVGFQWLGHAPTTALLAGDPPPNPPPVTAERRGVYLTAYAAGQPDFLEGTLDRLAEHGLNTVVVDIKNNQGEVCYASGVELAQRIEAVTPLLDLAAIVRTVHARGMYAIARQVVFYDPILARHLGLPSAPWVLPTVEAAITYNLDIAAEAERVGFDEIQFDYVRFPDDGPIGPDHSTRCQAVEAFLARARARLSLPLSADVYGRVMFPWNAQRIDPIGQHLEGMARWVDVISPMLYPSHYAEQEFKDDPYGTVRRGLECGGARVATPLRPYLQAFAMALPPGMGLAAYIVAQIEGAEEGGADGYLFWNPRCDYSAVWEALGLGDRP
ncbi:MAG: hypothetical protein Kow0097_00530 [Candidatus Bipolaricaulota bacterium]|nr:hypothetical protein [Candidatus Bipolaricaulota bacterium]